MRPPNNFLGAMILLFIVVELGQGCAQRSDRMGLVSRLSHGGIDLSASQREGLEEILVREHASRTLTVVFSTGAGWLYATDRYVHNATLYIDYYEVPGSTSGASRVCSMKSASPAVLRAYELLRCSLRQLKSTSFEPTGAGPSLTWHLDIDSDAAVPIDESLDEADLGRLTQAMMDFPEGTGIPPTGMVRLDPRQVLIDLQVRTFDAIVKWSVEGDPPTK
jgi:hypothetical protein